MVSAVKTFSVVPSALMRTSVAFPCVGAFLSSSMTETFAQQQGGIAFQRRVLDEAISTIEDYESFATVSDEEIQYNFIDLFTDKYNRP